MSLNYATPWDIKLGSDELSLKPLIGSFDIAQPKAAIAQPLIWSGQIDIVEGLAPSFPFDLSPRTNPSRWRQGQVVKLFIDNTLFLTLYLYRYFFADGEGQMQVQCRLGQNSGDRTVTRAANFYEGAASNSAGGSSYQRIVPWFLEVKRTLVEGTGDRGSLRFTPTQVITGGIPATLERTVNAVGPKTDGFSAEPLERNPDPIADAQEKAGARGYWLSMNSSNQVTLTRYPRSYSPVLRFARSEVDEFKLQPPADDPPPSSIKVVGRGVQSQPGESPQPPNADLGDRFNAPPEKPLPPCGTAFPLEIVVRDDFNRIIELTRTYRPAVSSNTVFRRVLKLMAADILFGEGGGLVTARDEQEEEYFDSEGKPLRKSKIVLEPLGVLDPANFPGNAGTIRSEVVTERWGYDAFKRPTSHSTTVRSPGFVVFGDPVAGAAPRFSRGETETWAAIGCGKYRYAKSKFTARGLVRPDPDNPFDDSPLLLPNESVEETLNSLPEPPYKEVEEDQEVEEYVESFEVTPDNQEPDTGAAEQTRELPHINSPEAAKDAAELILKMAQHGRYSWTVTRPVDTWTLVNYRPFQCEDIDGSRIVRDGFAVGFAQGQLWFQYTGLEVGRLGAPITKPTKRAVLRTTTLQVVEESDYSFTVGVPTSITLEAAGGFPPYTWSASGLPTGLSLTGNVISGSPTAIATTTVTTTVTDAAATTATDSFAIAVSEPPPVIPHYREITQVSAVVEGGWNVSLDFVTPPIAVPGAIESSWEVSAFNTRFIVESGWRVDIPIYITGAVLNDWDVELVETGLTQNLVAAYLFNGNLEDAVGSNDLSATGTEQYTTGEIGQAFLFDGLTYLSRASAAVLEMGAADFTIAFIFEFRGTGDLLGKWSDPFDPEYKIDIFSSDGVVAVNFTIASVGLSRSLVGDEFDLQGNRYLVVAWNSVTSDVQGISVRQIVTGSAEDTNTTTGQNRTAGTTDFKVGGDNSIAQANTWIDALYIWKGRILTAGERTSLYNFAIDNVEYPFTP